MPRFQSVRSPEGQSGIAPTFLMIAVRSRTYRTQRAHTISAFCILTHRSGLGILSVVEYNLNATERETWKKRLPDEA